MNFLATSIESLGAKVTGWFTVGYAMLAFLVKAGLLLLALGAYEVVSRMSSSRSYRLGAGVAIVTGFLVVWANAAVGMIGNEGNAWNLWFLGAIAVGAAGALITWFRPRGMAWSLYATAAVHAGAALYALAAGWDLRGAVFSLAFVFPWLLAAGLFRQAGQVRNRRIASS